MLALLLGLLPAGMAAGNASLSVTSGEAAPGGEVTLTVSVKDNPGLATYAIYIYYDTSVFSLNPDEDLKGMGAFSNGLLAGNNTDDRLGTLVAWLSGSGANVTRDGNMLSVTLHVKDNAASGAYSISLGYDPDNTVNETINKVPLNMSTGTVTVTGGTATPKPTPSPKPGETTNPPATQTPTFSDITGHWAYDSILAAAEAGLMEGFAGLFRPDDTMTRCEFATVLWRAAGCPAATKAAGFTDLDQEWYMNAISWATEEGLFQGDGTGRFLPMVTLSREQVVTVLHRMAGSPGGMHTMLANIYDEQFPDSGKIGSWARDGLYWSVYNGIYCGEAAYEVGRNAAPDAPATRGQLAVMMTRFTEKTMGA